MVNLISYKSLHIPYIPTHIVYKLLLLEIF